jgi:hypothetical protein
MENCDRFDEDKITKIYMSKYGIENVRGGTYTQITLLNYLLKTLEKELLSSTDKCYRCGRGGHFSKDCYANTHVNGKILNITCYKCDKLGHYSNECSKKIEICVIS